MPRYTVQHRYASNHNGRVFGPWEPDSEIEIDEPDAEWINRDSPDTLKSVPVKPPAATKAKTAGKASGS